MIPKRVPHGILKSLAPHFGISPDNLSGILNGHRGISKERAVEFSNIGEELGYNFSPEIWMFYPEQIKAVLSKEAVAQ